MFPILILSNEKNRKDSTGFQDWTITLKNHKFAIFEEVVDNFGRSGDDMIQWKYYMHI